MDDPSPDPPATRVRPVDVRDYVDFSTEAARRVRVYATERLALDVWCLEPRQATSALHLDQDVVYTVIAGRSWFVTDEGEVGLDPMGGMLVPAGVVHGFENRGADPLIVTAATSPAGDEPASVPVVAEGAAVVPDPGAGPLRRLMDRLLGGGER
jgi:mannose-6-phosphate isomerase-like protein (cupin superfamily)